jgi:hypothetical protein
MQASVSDRSNRGKATVTFNLLCEPDGFGAGVCLASGMDKKQINDPKMTLNFLI